MNAAVARAFSRFAQPQPLTEDQYAALTPEQLAAAGLVVLPQGAPADFGGTVLPNPDQIEAHWDTDEPAPTRLPHGVTFNRQNYMGGAQMDVSNPAAADIQQPMLRTIGTQRSGEPVAQQDWFEANAPKAVPAAGSSQDSDWFDQNAPKQTKSATQDDDSFTGILDRAWHRLKSAVNGDIPLTDYDAATLSGVASVARGTGHAIEGAAQMLKPPTWDELQQAVKDNPQNPAAAILARRAGKGLAHTAKQATEVPGAIHDINESADPAGTYAKVGQESLGDLAGQAIVGAATEGATEALPNVPKVIQGARELPSTIRQAAPAAVERASNAVRAIDPDVVGIVSPRAGHALKVAQRAAKVAGKYAGRAAGAGAETAAVNPVEDLEGVSSPQIEAAGESTEQTPEETAAAALAPAPKPAPKFTPKNVEAAVDQALGNKKPVPGVPLKDQIRASVQAEAPLPKDFTPVDSSVLKGYKYDPAKQEFTAILKNGQTYTHGEVTPDQVAAFENAESQGQAWTKVIRDNNVLLRKNGAPVRPIAKPAPATDLAEQIKESAGSAQPSQFKPATNLASQLKKAPRTIVVDPATGRPEFSDVLEARQAQPQASAAPTSAPETDLEAQLKQSLEKAPFQKAAKDAGRTITVNGKEVPRFVYRARTPGEQGVPFTDVPAHATSNFEQAMKFAEPGQRGANWNEVVRIDLSKLKPEDFSVRPFSGDTQWIKFHRALSEDEVSPFASQHASTK